MKKKFLALALITTVLVAGCGVNAQNSDEATTAKTTVTKTETSTDASNKKEEIKKQYFSDETGEPYSEASSDIAPVSSEELVAAVTEMLPDYITPGAELKSVTMNEDKNLSIVVDLTHANDNSQIQLPLDILAETSVSGITDPILDLDDEYYNAWDTISLDFGEYGHVTFSKSDVATNVVGRYFSYEGNVLQK